MIRSKRRCPECNQWLMSDETTCECGWKNKTQQLATVNHHCHYQVNLQGCPLPGTISSALNGSRTWHCSKHHQHINDPKRSYEIWHEAMENFEIIMDDYIDWRVKLIPEQYAVEKERLKQMARQLKIKGEHR